MGDAVVYDAQNVILAQARALRMLADSLDDDFRAAVNLLSDPEGWNTDYTDELHERICRHGRIIVTGIGKSALVGQKIAATFRATNSASYFLHATEALHGDLGGLRAPDAVLALSVSGRTDEVCEVLCYCRERGIRTVLITAAGGDHAADVVLRIPNLPEADDTGLVPTTSATCMMVLGDALALAVAKLWGFGASDLKAIHPGGAIGEKLREEGAG